MNLVPADFGFVLPAAFIGCCFFLFLANRLMPLIGHGPLKIVLLLSAFLLTPGGLVAAVLVLPSAGRIALLAVALALLLAGELRLQILRRSLAGSPPVDTVPHRTNLARPMTTTDIVTHRYRIRIPGWRGPPVRIAHVSDLHVNPAIPESYFRAVFDAAAQADPDLLFLTGDFVTDASSLPILQSVLRPAGRHGCFAVLGNHDYWAGHEQVRGVVRAAGITLLHGESARVPFGGGTILVSGIDYPWGEGTAEVGQAGQGMLHLVLSHTPDNIYRLSRTSAHCVFSGHMHAGQFRIPWVGSFVVPSRYGRLFDHGHFVVRDTHLFVVSGVGAAAPPFRIYCQPDIFVVEIGGETTAVS